MIKTYTKFLINGFIKSFLNVFFVMMCLVLILNILKEIEFFSNKEVNSSLHTPLPSSILFIKFSSLSVNMVSFIFFCRLINLIIYLATRLALEI